LLTIFFYFFGCSESEPLVQEPPAQKVQVLRTPKHVSSSQEDYEQKSFVCCTNKEFQNVLTTYVDLTQSMAQDLEKQSLDKRNILQTQLSEIQKINEDKEIIELQSLLQDLQPKSLVDLQKHFAPFSIKMVEWAQSIAVKEQKKNQKELRVIVGFCPMAPPPGRWLQREDVIQNPFYGSKMLTCGVFE
jgi:hypothetical protein